MARNQVKQLWTVIVTAFLALCTALGLVTTNAATAVAQTEPTRNSGTGEAESPQVTIPAQSSRPRSPWSLARALPPTMKQRIHAEAHGKSPSCRHRPLPDADAATTTVPATDAAPAPAAPCDTLTATAPRVPLQR
ncbi:DUF6344 domain-containing protein [Streptomyces sp. NPDC057386]|jgi:hypothetical protein|uniref:DUF6344 domain-containing protein n=1 Tax=Streptomyces thermocoprophilus TaxID=78356 RepID=A0ABV5VGF6_9ACTN